MAERHATGLVIVSTFYLPHPLDGGDARFEIETVNSLDWFDAAEADKPAETRKRLKRTPFLTKDPALFEQANEHLEGPPVTLTWQPGKRSNGETCKVVSAITRDTSQAHAEAEHKEAASV